ncbi:helix-turn-helix domain-containing protein [Paraburkholderia aspalathi]|uniref:helix-turn-helix domain-containing protein n=1 Tax=Paraburkholderia aspalathi TaxID=1324617 RepID=UPI001F46A5D7|nr:helix-turn-helix domain-containing protein [Paraburkholderia aspalathi]
MLVRGFKPGAIAGQLDVSGQTVYNWFHAWRDSGVFGLMGGPQRWPCVGPVRRDGRHGT